MADVRIQDAAVATTVNLTDRIPVSQGDNLPKAITVEQILEMTPVVTGPQGPQGIQGPAGADGAQGLQGIQGLDGPAGADSTVPGPPGYTPIKDVDYFDGAQGPQGLPGADGAQGVKGDTGDAGADSTVAGPQGIQGVAGETGPAGVGIPTGGTAGQVLAKVDATDYNSAWVDTATGSGLTNPMTTAGDIIIGGVAGAPTRLAKGTNGQVLTMVADVPAYADASGGSTSSGVTVFGTLTISVALSTTLTITNYDSATTYSVSATAGTATITGDTITYTAGDTEGSVTLTITAGAVTRDITLTIDPLPQSFIPTPATTPAAFGDAFEGGFYTGMIWNELVQTETSTAIETGSKTFTVPNMLESPLVYEGQTLEVRSRANPANKMVGVVTGAKTTNLVINITSVGGSGTFTDWSIMARYRVIVAPKASGESTSKKYKNVGTAAPTACQTLSEGRKATLAMVAAGDATTYPAAWFCTVLNIGSKTDWYLPARDELELCWRNLKPTADSNYATANRTDSATNYTNLGSLDDTATTPGANNNSIPVGAAYVAGSPAQVAAGKNFRTGESESFVYASTFYWSSSVSTTTEAWKHSWSSSIAGYQNHTPMTDSICVRAVRRSII